MYIFVFIFFTAKLAVLVPVFCVGNTVAWNLIAAEWFVFFLYLLKVALLQDFHYPVNLILTIINRKLELYKFSIVINIGDLFDCFLCCFLTNLWVYL